MKTVLVKIAFIAFLRVARGNLVAALYLYRCELRRRCFVALLTVQLFYKKTGYFRYWGPTGYEMLEVLYVNLL